MAHVREHTRSGDLRKGESERDRVRPGAAGDEGPAVFVRYKSAPGELAPTAQDPRNKLVPLPVGSRCARVAMSSACIVHLAMIEWAIGKEYAFKRSRHLATRTQRTNR